MEKLPNSEDSWDQDSNKLEKLKELGFDTSNGFRGNSLVQIIRKGDLSNFVVCLKDTNFVNKTDDQGLTPLLAAIICNETTVAEWFLSQGANVNTCDSRGNSPLLISSLKCNSKLTEQIVDKGANINYQNEQGYTALMAAAYSGDKKKVELLFQKGANLNIQSNLGVTALMFATSQVHINIVQYLAQHANCTITENKGSNIIAIAARHGNVELLKCFYKLNVNINTANKQGKTGLMYAAEEGHFSAVEYLVDTARASTDMCMVDGKKASDIALMRKHTHIARFLCGTDVVDFECEDSKGIGIISAAYNGSLIKVTAEVTQAKVDVDITDKHGRTALMAAAQKGHKDIVIYLVENNASINQISKSGLTALAYSVQGMHFDIQKYLLLQNGDLEEKDEDGRTIFMRCVENGNLELVKALNILGCDLFYREPNLKKNSLMIAAEKGFMDVVEYLMSQGGNTQSVSSEGMTAEQYAFINNHQEVHAWLQSYGIVGENEISQKEDIMACAERGDCNGLLNLFNLGCSMNYRNAIQNTPLIIAAENGHVPFVKWLIEHGAIVNYRNPLLGRTALFVGVLNGNGLVVDHLLKAGASANIVDRKGHTALMAAAQELYVDIALNLLNHGARANTKEFHGKSAIAFAALSGCLDIAKQLLKYGANVNYVDQDGDSPLHLASAGGHMEMVKLLVSSGADIDHINNQGRVAMDCASQNSHDDIILYLLSCGAIHPIVHTLYSMHQNKIIDIKDIHAIGQKAESVSKKEENISQSEHKSILKEALFAICNDNSFDAAAAEEVLAQGYDVNNADDEGSTALLVAVKNKHSTSSEWLIDAGANVNMQDHNGMTALMCVSQYQCDHILNLLLHRGADVNITDHKGNTALSHAVICNQTLAADTLLKAGADGNHRNNNGNTPLITAIVSQSIDMVHLLLKHNVSPLIKDSNDRTPLSHAVSCCVPASLEVVHMLIRSHEGVNNFDQNGNTPLMLSLITQNIDIAKELISIGCDLNQENHFGESTILIAASNGNIEVLNLIFQRATELDTRQLALGLQFLIYNDQNEIFPMFYYYEIVFQSFKRICNVSALSQLATQNNIDTLLYLQRKNLFDLSTFSTLFNKMYIIHMYIMHNDFTSYNACTTELFQHIICTFNNKLATNKVISTAFAHGCYEDGNKLATSHAQHYGSTSKTLCLTLACDDEDLLTVTDDNVLKTHTAGTCIAQNVTQKYSEKLADIYKAIEKCKEQKDKLDSENLTLEESFNEMAIDHETTSVENMCDEKNKQLCLIQEEKRELQLKIKELLEKREGSLIRKDWQVCECGKASCFKCEFEKEALEMFTQTDVQFTGLPENVTHDTHTLESQQLEVNRNKPPDNHHSTGKGRTYMLIFAPMNSASAQQQRSRENVRSVSVISHDDKPYPKMYLFKFHATVSQCAIDGRQMPSNACAIIAMLFAQRFVKRPVIIPVIPSPLDVPDKVFNYVVLAIREGNQVHELNFEGMPVDLGPDEVSLLTNHLGVKLVEETDVDTRDPETLVQYVWNLKPNQVILFIKNYRVVSVLPCNSNKWLLLFDSHPHPQYNKMYGAYLFLAKKDKDTIKKLFISYDMFCDPRPFYGKFAIFDV